MAGTKGDKGRKTPSRRTRASSRSSGKKKTSSRKRGRPKKSSAWIVVTLCLAIVLGIILYRHVKQPTTTFAQRAKVVDQLLLAQFYQLEIPRKDIRKWQEPRTIGGKTWTLSHWEVMLPQGVRPENVTSQLRQQVEEAYPRVTLSKEKTPDGALGVDLKIDGLLAHHLILRPPKLKPPKPRFRMAIVVDDLGLDKKAAEELLRLEIPLTFSILPFRPFSSTIAQRAHAHGREVILHLPMEPRGYPLKDPGKGALFVSMSEKELVRQLKEDLDAVPFIKGVNNHMGSRFMEDRKKVRVVLQELKKRDLFFLDSLTTSKSKGYRIAQELALKVDKRNLFLDNEVKVKDIEAQLKRLTRIARTGGKAIGICHPHPSTIAALKNIIPKLHSEGVEVVPLSHIVD